MRKIAVIGAGLAGLYTAWSAASHGADVELYEKGVIGTKHNCGELFTEIYTSAPEECKLNRIKTFKVIINDKITDIDFGENSPFVMTDKCQHELIMKKKCEELGVNIIEKTKINSGVISRVEINATGTSNYEFSMGKAVTYIAKNMRSNVIYKEVDLSDDDVAVFDIRDDLMGYKWFFPKGKDLCNIGEGVYDYRYKTKLMKPEESDIIFSGGGLLPMPNMKEFYYNMTQYSMNIKVGNAAGLVNPCVLPNTEIITSNGVKEIKDIVVGDKVLTHEGRFRKATKVFIREYKGDVIEIRPSVSSKSIILTPEHPVYSSSRCMCGWKGFESRFCWYDCQMCYQGHGGLSGKCFTEGCQSKFYENYLDNITWKNSKDLDLTDSLCYPIMKEEDDVDIDNYINIGNLKMLVSYYLMEFIGYYIAEGHGAKNGSRIFLDFGLNSNENECKYVDEVVNLADTLFNKRAYVDIDDIGRQRISINDIYITKFLSDNFGRVSKEKVIPEWVINLNNDLLIHLVKCMWNGDGCIKEPYQYIYYTASKNLAYTLKLVLNKLRIVCKVKIDNRVGRLSHFRDGDYYTNGGYSIVISNSFISKMNQILGYDEDFNVKQTKVKSKVLIRSRLADDTIISCIDSISHKYYEGKVYNLEVEDDNSYCTESMALHNCMGGGEHLAVISGILAGELVAKTQEYKYYEALTEIIGDEMRFGISGYELLRKLDISSVSRLIELKLTEQVDYINLNNRLRKTIRKWITLPEVANGDLMKFVEE